MITWQYTPTLTNSTFGEPFTPSLLMERDGSCSLKVLVFVLSTGSYRERPMTFVTARISSALRYSFAVHED